MISDTETLGTDVTQDSGAGGKGEARENLPFCCCYFREVFCYSCYCLFEMYPFFRGG